MVATLVPCFQQWTGINSIMFYAPIIFKTINPQSGALLATMITGVINVLATFISIALVEKAGRKVMMHQRPPPLVLSLPGAPSPLRICRCRSLWAAGKCLLCRSKAAMVLSCGISDFTEIRQDTHSAGLETSKPAEPYVPVQMLFLVGGFQMVVAEVVVAALLGSYFTAEADWVVPENVGLAVLIIICIFVSGFAYRCQLLLPVTEEVQAILGLRPSVDSCRSIIDSWNMTQS